MKPRPCPWAKAARSRARREGAKLMRERKTKWRGTGPAKPADWQERIAAELARQAEETRKHPPRLSDAHLDAIVDSVRRS